MIVDLSYLINGLHGEVKGHELTDGTKSSLE